MTFLSKVKSVSIRDCLDLSDHHVPLLKAYLLSHVAAIIGNNQDKPNTTFPHHISTCFRHPVQREGVGSTWGDRSSLFKSTFHFEAPYVTCVQLYFSSSVASSSELHLLLTTVKRRV